MKDSDSDDVDEVESQEELTRFGMRLKLKQTLCQEIWRLSLLSCHNYGMQVRSISGSDRLPHGSKQSTANFGELDNICTKQYKEPLSFSTDLPATSKMTISSNCYCSR